MKLLRVVPVARDLQLGGGWRIVVASIELWDEVVAARWTVISENEPIYDISGDRFVPRLAEGTEPLVLSDDAGTDYQRLGGGAGSGGRVDRIHELWSDAAFEPAIPDGARVLTVSTHRSTAALDIQLP